MATLAELKDFDIDAAEVSLWLFKGPNGTSDSPPHYPGRWVETTTEVEEVLRQVVKSEINRVEETIEFELLAQNNEASALVIPRDETHADILITAAAVDAEGKKISDSGQILNTRFYLIKFVQEESVLYAVRRTATIWKTKRAKAVFPLFFSEERLDVDDRPHFDLEKNIDFMIFDNQVFILQKSAFESILRYKQAHLEDFSELQHDEDFVGAFVDTTPFVEHVGTNKIRLRRVAALREKSHFRNAEFMTRLRERHADYGFTFEFDAQGRIIATPETASQILTALLDHRLTSAFSQLTYDVPSSTQVNL